MKFAQWLEAVESNLQHLYNATLYNIPSSSFKDIRALYDAGHSPDESAHKLIDFVKPENPQSPTGHSASPRYH